jgi:23S rRNA (uracil1939-C5)-methyltransferase
MRRKGNRKQQPLLTVTLEISKLSHEGRGIAYREGKVVFVEGALRGETVVAQVYASKGNFEEAKTLEILRAAPERVIPPCPHAQICGGCSLQHLSTDAQLAFKQDMLHELLSHQIGHANYEKFEAVTGPVLAYRRKARLGVRYITKKSKVMVGFREKNSNFLTDMDSCAVLDPQVSDLLPALSACIGSMDAFNQIAQIEVAVGDATDVLPSVALVFRHLIPLGEEDKLRLVDFAREHGVDVYLQPKGPDSVHLLSPERTTMRLQYVLPDHDLSMLFHPLDFTQVNAHINRQMLLRTIDLLAPQSTDRILDLFCGLGNFTLPLARLARHVVGVEGVSEMVERGNENARLNGITNVEFHCADLTQPVETAVWVKEGFNKILLDPPRSGAYEVLPALVKLAPQLMVYISCNPATLARDAAYLVQAGYTLKGAGILDMFPHTTHVESIAVFEKA